MKRFLLVFLVILLYAPLVFGLPGLKIWKAVWNANTETDVAGYYLYWRTGTGIFSDTDRIDLGNVTKQTLTGVIPDNAVIAVTCYDTSQNEGGYSDEAPFDKDSTAPAAVGGLQIVEQ